jgi:hypothetical protein
MQSSGVGLHPINHQNFLSRKLLFGLRDSLLRIEYHATPEWEALIKPFMEE